jgi:uncharacterized membrane protein
MRCNLISAILLAALFATLGCSGLGVEPIESRACENPTTLRFANFGADFMQRHCQSCHSELDERDVKLSPATAVPAFQRKTTLNPQHTDIPSGYNFGSLAAVKKHRTRIYERSAGANTSMPPGPDDPTETERQKLAEWLACSPEF